MRIPGRTVLTAGVLALAVTLLSACTASGGSSGPPPTSAPTPTPVFTSDAQALAAATAVYKEYVRASDEIGHDGGSNPERVRPYVSAAGLQQEIGEAQKIANDHAKGYGYTKINNTILQSHEESNGVATVRIYACQDLSEVDLRDASGRSLVSSDRPDYVDYLAELQTNAKGQLVVDSNKFWSGGGICKF